MTDENTSRDETAFSVDPFTNAPAKTGGEIDRATVAMKALDAEHVDQDGYHELLTDDAKYAAYVGSEDAKTLAEPVEPEPVELVDPMIAAQIEPEPEATVEPEPEATVEPEPEAQIDPLT